MATLKRIEPASAMKIGAIIYAFLGLFIGIVLACISLVAGSLTRIGGNPMGMGALGVGMGFGSIIVAPIVYAIIGAIGAGLAAVVYNLAARLIGGVEVDIS
jgi:hypothetical protein